MPDRVHRVYEIGMHAHDLRAAVREEVHEIFRRQPVVERHDDRADLRDGVVLLEMLVRVECDGGDTIAQADAKSLQRGRPAIASGTEFGVREAVIAIHHGLVCGVQLAGAAEEVERGQRSFHGEICLPSLMGWQSTDGPRASAGPLGSTNPCLWSWIWLYRQPVCASWRVKMRFVEVRRAGGGMKFSWRAVLCAVVMIGATGAFKSCM